MPFSMHSRLQLCAQIQLLVCTRAYELIIRTWRQLFLLVKAAFASGKALINSRQAKRLDRLTQ